MGYDLARHGTPLSGLSNRQFGKEMDKAVRGLLAEGQLTTQKVEIVAEVTGRAMDLATQLDMRRRLLAGEDDGLNQVLGQIELGFVSTAIRLQQSMFPSWR